MKFSISFVALVSTALFAVVHAAPAPMCNGELCSEVAARDLSDVAFDDLAVRASKAKAPAKAPAKASKKSSGSQKANISQGILNAQKKQGNRVEAQKKKTATNKKHVQQNGAKIKADVNAARDKAKAKGKPLTPAQVEKKKTGAASRVISQKQKDNKQAKKTKLAAAKKTPEQKKDRKAAQTARRADRKKTGTPAPANAVSTKQKVSKQQKHAVKQRFQSAKDKLGKTQGLPGRKSTVAVGKEKTDGRAVRQAAFNTHLHSKTPIGRNPINKQPKQFNNRPYDKAHKDASLRGKKPLPQNGKEYPIKNNSPNGYTGQGSVGALRTVTYKKGGQNHVKVLGHDASRGTDPNDHYVGKREFDLDFEDFE
ncbi:hypothetical protein EST38_g7913 [Candolleomyces aberdarensis]|uniref:Uncharacterized protein n=1 Tax=Candolleomyces aberdarensis TaxID=2316362 RepID=A0A4Q2DFR5_9AGAR|nr:hypothetical protein EST38_g7913 [Candolleomyces aberdarensis]